MASALYRPRHCRLTRRRDRTALAASRFHRSEPVVGVPASGPPSVAHFRGERPSLVLVVEPVEQVDFSYLAGGRHDLHRCGTVFVLQRGVHLPLAVAVVVFQLPRGWKQPAVLAPCAGITG